MNEKKKRRKKKKKAHLMPLQRLLKDFHFFFFPPWLALHLGPREDTLETVDGKERGRPGDQGVRQRASPDRCGRNSANVSLEARDGPDHHGIPIADDRSCVKG